MLVGCGRSSTDSEAPSVMGHWRFDYTNLTFSVAGYAGVTPCDNMTLTFVMTGSDTTFTGAQRGSERLSCIFPPDLAFDATLTGLAVTDGHVSGSAISFFVR